ncbi:hypothetical protein CN204_20435 [Sinorhizobium meliloti]|uniref:Uncharacterized protein n=1 Tax=Sinorhizobium medicae TaxID=110321 RepID=A0ABX4TMU2_9HYPH|nr:hypothetical protein [Sinorhizobium meliloti]MDX0603868.1 hypothetical protein [Sinorhizobium medicae]MDW9866388.1 hypothetical protein [Sinorhizobium meliloti]MDX0819386.1 hypothetical protein [Sinorhizobium medicae]MDX0863181.1 hypothetical protein [Sinorhizobium medicae]
MNEPFSYDVEGAIFIRFAMVGRPVLNGLANFYSATTARCSQWRHANLRSWTARLACLPGQRECACTATYVPSIEKRCGLRASSIFRFGSAYIIENLIR